MKKMILPILLSLVILPGCGAFIQEQHAKRKMSHTLDNLMGQTEEAVIIQLGSPNKVEQLAGLTIYHYYKSYGTRSSVYVGEMYGQKDVWETYDQFEIIFKDGHVINWKGSVKR